MRFTDRFQINRENTKLVVGAVVGFGSGMVVKTLIQSNVIGDRIDRKIGIKIGAWALGGLAAKASKEFVNTRVDDIFDAYEKFMADKQ